MNILYVIGNGLDLSIGLKTSYMDFEKYYKTVPSMDPIIQKFKKEINPGSSNWSDLEVAMGEYTEKITNADDFVTIYYDLLHLLKEYLQEQDKLIPKWSSEARINIQQHLIKPYVFLEPVHSRAVQQYCNLFDSANNRERYHIDFVTFNYTSSIEKIIFSGGGTLSSYDNRNLEWGQVRHVHGELSIPPIIMGVNSIDQINNREIAKDNKIQRFFIKPNANKEILSDNDNIGLALIENANIIVCYGCSLGKTDSFWWDAIYEHMKDSSGCLIIHQFTNDKFDMDAKPLWMQDEMERVKESFLKNIQQEIPPEEKDKIKKKIIVAFDKPLFKI